MGSVSRVGQLSDTIFAGYINITWKNVLDMLKLTMCNNNSCDNDMKVVLKWVF